MVIGFASGSDKRGLPGGTVGQDMHKPLYWRHVVGISGSHALPPVCVVMFVCRKVEHGHQPGLAVGAVVIECLAGPLARDQDAPTGVAEVLVPVGFASA